MTGQDSSLDEEADPSGQSEEWVVVGTFPHGMDLVFIEAALEDAEIRYFKKDELTIQVVPYLSQALGGVRVLVHPVDRQSALDIFKECGVEMEDEPVGSPLLERFDQVTKSLPLLGRMGLGWRFLAMFASVLVPLSFALHAYFTPKATDMLTKGMWCVTWMEIDGTPITPNTLAYLKLVSEGCSETMTFGRNGSLSLPGLNTAEVQAEWVLEADDRIRILHSDTVASVYDGLYALRLNDRVLALRSAHVRIEAKKWRFGLGL